MAGKVAIWKLDKNLQHTIIRLPMESESLDSVMHHLPGGAYTTFRTYHLMRVLRLQNHFQRLQETANLAGIRVELDENRVRAALREAIAAYDSVETRIRVILDLVSIIGDLYVLIEPLLVPSKKDYEDGVRVVTRFMQRHNPKAKLTGFIETAAKVRQMVPAEINEVVMVGENGRVLEGLSSNFFALFNGELWTAEQGVLSGITRSIVLEAIEEIHQPLQKEGVKVENLPNISEAFLTSASRSVLPVTAIDGRSVGSGRPGPVTEGLSRRYCAIVERDLEDI